ncbi:hypothetical protein, partial [Prevotella melaninogenica]|uniref:hypothetical protein n=1 Tax=Prevotella melaninogenica TaxID=28132 RepID=UPI001E32A743
FHNGVFGPPPTPPKEGSTDLAINLVKDLKFLTNIFYYKVKRIATPYLHFPPFGGVGGGFLYTATTPGMCGNGS